MRTVLLVSVACVLGGALVGALSALLTATYYVPVLVPIAMGAGCGMALGFVVHYVGLRRRSWVVLAALATWLLCVSTFHWVEYRVVFTNGVRIAYDQVRAVDGGPPLSDEEALAMTEDLLVERTGHGGVKGFLLYRGRAGLKIRLLQERRLGMAWSMGLWCLDLLVLFLVIARISLGVFGRIPSSGISRLNGEELPRYTIPADETAPHVVDGQRADTTFAEDVDVD
jgi:hypothetical protein